MGKLASYEQLEGSSGPPSPSSPRVKKGCGACGGIPGARWLSKSFKERRNGIIKRKPEGQRRSSRKRGRDAETEAEAEAQVELNRDLSVGSDSSDRGVPAYAGWVYHVGTNSLGYQFCTDRFMVIKGKYVAMFKRDPGEYPRAVRPLVSSGTAPTLLNYLALTRQCPRQAPFVRNYL